MAVIEVEIVSDPVCVWCFVGKRTLDKAISMYQKTYPDGKKDTFKLVWKPYYLGYYPHERSVDKSELEKIKFKDMTPEAVGRLRNRMNQIGKSVGINYKYGGKTKYNNSQDGVIEGIFSAYHEHEQDITDLEVLGDIAEKSGLNREEVVQYLQSDQDKTMIDEQAQLNRDQVTTGVPTFLIQSKHRVDGAQDLQEFVEAFIRVKKEEK